MMTIHIKVPFSKLSKPVTDWSIYGSFYDFFPSRLFRVKQAGIMSPPSQRGP